MSLHKKILKVTPDAVITLMQAGIIRVDRNALPDDARVVHASVDARGDLVFVIESKTFKKVSILDPTPVLASPQFSRLIDRPNSPYIDR